MRSCRCRKRRNCRRKQCGICHTSTHHYFHRKKDCCKRSLKEASKSGCHSRNQYYPAVVREVESAGKRMGKCSTDLHGNALAPRTSAKQMCDPCTGHDKWNECQWNRLPLSLPASMTSVIPFDAVSLKCRYRESYLQIEQKNRQCRR